MFLGKVERGGATDIRVLNYSMSPVAWLAAKPDVRRQGTVTMRCA